jgi:SAM-dependent methyltransferase
MIDALLDRRLAGLEMGSAPWFAAQRRMIDDKPLIRRCYDLWYSLLLRDADSVPVKSARCPIIELGSGCSFLRELRPGIITSDVTTGNIDVALDGRALPFRSNSVRALLLTHVFHHIPDVKQFLLEADRVLVPGGVISIVDVTHTPFARLFFSVFHPEPYNDKAPEWDFPPGHTMLDSNQALSWMVFFRDRERLLQMDTGLILEQTSYLPWFSYLLSGGVNLPTFVPKPLTTLVRAMDRILRPIDPLFAIHWHMTVRKRS